MCIAANFLSNIFPEIEPINFYKMVFKDYKFEQGYNLIYSKKDLLTGETKNKIINDVSNIEQFDNNYFYIMSPISYSRGSKKSINARQMFAIVFELDFPENITQSDLEFSLSELLYRCKVPRLHSNENLPVVPMPTAIVASGHGVHLYYVLDKPINMFRNIQTSLKRFRQEFIHRIWNEDITEEPIQHLPVVQGYRMAGSITKTNKTTRAFLTGDIISIDVLNQYVHYENRIVTEWESKISLNEAKSKWPDWYERVIVKKERPSGWSAPHWSCNPAVYYWWLNLIKSKVTVGHRYNCLRCLVIYAVKCKHVDKHGNDIGITYEQLSKDVYSLVEQFDKLSISDKNKFTARDADDALLNYQPSYYSYPINSISAISGINIPKTKRNGQKREWHLEDMRDRKQKMKERGQPFKNPDGRPNKRNLIVKYKLDNPNSSKLKCSKDLNISYPTVCKWWDA